MQQLQRDVQTDFGGPIWSTKRGPGVHQLQRDVQTDFGGPSTSTEHGAAMQQLQLHKQNVSTGSFHSYTIKPLGAEFVGGKKSQEQARTNLSKTDIFMAKDHTYFKGGKGFVTKIYGGVNLSALKSNWEDDHHLYEILGESRKVYFDLDFPFISHEEEKKTLEATLNFIKEIMKGIGAPFNDDEVAICGVADHPNKDKSSYHLILNNGFLLNGMDSVQSFGIFLRSKISMTIYFDIIDCSVYSKNRAFKLPFQTKGLDNLKGLGRPSQKPLNGRNTLDDFLISHNLPDQNTFINFEGHRKISGNVGTYKKRDGTRTVTVRLTGNIVEQFRTHYTGKNISTTPTGEPSRSPEYLVRSIFNDPTMKRDIWMGVGSAIKRIFINKQDDGLKLFNEWSSGWLNHSDPVIAADRRNKFEDDQKAGWKRFLTNRCGYRTLKCLALECNENLHKIFYSPWSLLFDNDVVEGVSEVAVINKRYICDEFDVRQTVRDYQTVFIKSPMGTGKSHAIKQLLRKPMPFDTIDCNYHNVLYLSSKRAFSSAMTAEFKQHGFVSYLDPGVGDGRTVINRLFCSIESLHIFSERLPHLFDNLDLLIMDESESLFSIVSSETLRTNNPEKNLQCLTTLMRVAKRVVVMDAYLNNRSVKPLSKVRGLHKTTSFFLRNDWKPPIRFCKLIKTNVAKNLYAVIDNCLKEGKKVVAIIGSKKLADRIVNSVSQAYGAEKKIKYYSSEKRLDRVVDVKKEWKNIDLLIYTPTITCGVNYPKIENEEENFDVKVIHCVNTGSSNFRDTKQASHRVRYCRKNTVILGMSIFGHDRERFPDTIEEVTERLECLQKIQLLGSGSRSVKDVDHIQWAFETMVFNEFEKNINALYLQEIVEEYFRRDNIHFLREGSSSGDTLIHSTFLEAKKDDWKFDDIINIDRDVYLTHMRSSVNQRCFVELKVRKEIAKYEFLKRTKPETSQYDLKKTFDFWHKKKNREFTRHIYLFKEVLHRRTQNEHYNFVYKQGTDVIEFFQPSRTSFPHIIYMLENLGAIENGYLNISRIFTTADLEDLLNNTEKFNYKTVETTKVNELIRGWDYVYRGRAQEVTAETLKSILGLILKSFFNYRISNRNTVRKRLGNKRISEYILEPVAPKKSKNPCLFTILNDMWPDLDT